VECKKIDRTANAAYIHTDIYIYIYISRLCIKTLIHSANRSTTTGSAILG